MSKAGTGFALLAIALAAAMGCSAVLPPGFGQKPAAGASAAPATAVSFKTDVTAVLKNHCAGCHTAGGSGAGNLEMFDQAGTAKHATIKARVGEMIDAINRGRMPLGKPGSVPADQVQKLKDWQAAGGPDN